MILTTSKAVKIEFAYLDELVSEIKLVFQVVSVRFSITKFQFISIQVSTFLSQFLYLSSL